MKTCHTCLKILEEGTFAIKPCDFFTDETSDKALISLKDQLADYVPEFLLSTYPNTFLCQSCAAAINGAYKFKRKCLETRTKIQSYINSMPLYTQINIEDVALHYRQLEIGSTGGDPTAIHKESKDVAKVLNSVKEESLPPPNKGHAKEKSKIEAVESRKSSRDSTVDKKRKSSSKEARENKTPSNFTPVKEDVILSSEPLLNTDEVYKCTLCKNLISSYSRFCYHMLLHNNQNATIKCSKCHFTCFYNRELVFHLKKHKIVYKDACHLCDCRFPDKTALTIHMRSHANLGCLFICKFCKFHFDEHTELKLHLESHSKYHKFECDTCTLRFPSRRKLKIHYWNHIAQTKTFLSNTKVTQNSTKRKHKDESQSEVPVKRRLDSRSQINGKTSRK